jgi:hypothetical protein
MCCIATRYYFGVVHCEKTKCGDVIYHTKIKSWDETKGRIFLSQENIFERCDMSPEKIICTTHHRESKSFDVTREFFTRIRKILQNLENFERIKGIYIASMKRQKVQCIVPR